MQKFPVVLIKQHPEFSVFKKMKTPADVQDFLNTLKTNFEIERETYHSPLMTLRTGRAHCMEGAMLASAALWYQGRPPIIFDLRTTKDDFDHVVALFKEGNRWGALAKGNHAVLRYRDPIYRDLRELAMSFFHEYFLDNGKKTLRAYSAEPFNIVKRFGIDWLTTSDDLWDIGNALDDARHTTILDKGTERRLRLAEDIEIKAGKIVVEKMPRRARWK